MKFRSEKYRYLMVRLGLSHKVKFTAGVADVTDEATAEALLAFARRHPEYDVHPESAEPAEGDSAEDDEETDDENEGVYDSLPRRALVAEAETRGLDPSGTKAALVERLEADDAAAADDGDDDTDDDTENE